MTKVAFYRDTALPFFELKRCATGELSYKEHAHEEYSVGIVEKGQSRFWYAGQTKALYPQTLVLLPPGLMHACNPVDPECWQYTMLYIDKIWVKNFMTEADDFSLDCPAVKDISGTGMLSALNRLVQRLTSPVSPLEKETVLLSVLTQALTGERQLSESEKQTDPAQVQAVRTYLCDHFTERVTLQELEAASGLNKFHIIRLFNAAFKVPPHQYQMLLRINNAKKILRGELPLAEVALAVGFYDQSHFVKAFKRYVGITPERYRAHGL